MIKRILLILLIMLLSSCDKIEICKIEEDKTNNYNYDYAVIIGVDGAGNFYKDSKETDFEVKNAVCDYLSTNIPTVLFVQFDEADEAGHEYGYQSEKKFE